MADAAAASILDAVLGMTLGGIAAQPGTSRMSLEGVALSPDGDGTWVTIERLAAESLRLAAGPLGVEVGRFELRGLSARVRSAGSKPEVDSLEAQEAGLAGFKADGALTLSARHLPATDHWTLEPLATVDGNIRAEIVDAHLMFDADVKVPIRQGRIDFKDATVEHVGPDSRMGVSRMGLYVDAPNGRSYLYQFSSAPVAGVEFERRGAMLGPWVTDRGRLALQPFLEGLLRQGPAAHGLGVTEQARLLLGRTALWGELQLGDGRFAAPGLQAQLTGRAQGRNIIRLRSEAVGRGLTAELAALSVAQVQMRLGKLQLMCVEVTGGATLRLFIEGGQLRFALDIAQLKASGLSLQPA